jgi:hypothetical protein
MRFDSIITEWDIVFKSRNKYFKFLRDIENLDEVITDAHARSNIILYCPIGKEYITGKINFIVYPIKNNGDIDFFNKNEDIMVVELKNVNKDDILRKDGEMKLYGHESWIPFLAKYLIGSFKVLDIDDNVWGAKLFGDGSFEYN